MWQLFCHIWWFPYFFFLTFDDSISHYATPTLHLIDFLSYSVVPLFFLTFDSFFLTFCSSNITYDNSFVTFGDSFIFYSHLTIPSSYYTALTSHLTIFFITFSGFFFFFFHIWRIHAKEDDFIPFRPVFIVPMCTLVQKRMCFMPVKKSAMPDPFLLYREMYQVSAEN